MSYCSIINKINHSPANIEYDLYKEPDWEHPKRDSGTCGDSKMVASARQAK